jgi:hypothetical protein
MRGGILVICEKCGGKVNDNGRCSLCGYDNSNVQLPKNYKVKPKLFRSTRVTVFMYLVISFNFIALTILMLSLFRNIELITGVIIISILLCVLEIIVAFFILKLKKWALITYIILCIIDGIIKLLRLDFIPIILKALLLYFIFKNDWEYFD